MLTEICRNKNDSAKQVILQLTQPAFILGRMYLAQVCKAIRAIFFYF